jgi:hypothetical protein
MKWVFYLSIFLSFPLHAKSTWIAAIGIDTNSRTQNFNQFYDEARAFLDVCQSSPLKPDCHLSMNADPSQAADPEMVTKLNFPEGTRSSTAAEFLERFTNSLDTAEAGDTIVLSLTDHGGPRTEANSCIYLDQTQPVCETHIRDALRHRKPGVKVFIHMAGCFSGAFADLADPEVCIATGSDRRTFGYASNQYLWQAAKAGNYSNLGDARRDPSFSYGFAPLFASQSMATLLCNEIRTPDFINQFSMIPYEFSWENLCGSSVGEQLNYTLQTVNNFVTYLKREFTCGQSTSHHPLCLSLGTFTSNEYQNDLSELINVAQPAGEIWSSLFDTRSYIDDSGLSEEEKSLLELYIILDFTPEDSFTEETEEQRARLLPRLQKSRAEMVRLETQLKHIQLEYYRRVEDLSARYNQAEAMNFLSSCLFPVESKMTEDQSRYLIATGREGGRFPRTFTYQDYKDAYACENSFPLR